MDHGEYPGAYRNSARGCHAGGDHYPSEETTGGKKVRGSQLERERKREPPAAGRLLGDAQQPRLRYSGPFKKKKVHRGNRQRRTARKRAPKSPAELRGGKGSPGDKNVKN